ncbi:MAG: hypothetical protein IKP36_07205 [Bacteroidaceae bacterium]|nr:hypothetical protein [Bacteroidaceae bacterium]
MRSQLNSLLDCAGPYNAWQYRYIHYCREEDTCFVLKCVGTSTINGVTHHYMRIQPINMFGPRLMNPDDNAEVTELGIVPACIDHTDDAHGDMLFVECGTLGDDEEDAEDRDENQTQPVNTLIAGEKEKKKTRYFKNMPIDLVKDIMTDKSDDEDYKTKKTTIIVGRKEDRIGSLIDEAKDELKETAEKIFNFSIGITQTELDSKIHDKSFIIEKSQEVLNNYLSYEQ